MIEMSRRQATASRIQQRRLSAIIRTDDQALASDAMDAAVEGGFTLVEFTLTIPGALDLIQSFSSRSNLTVGAGTVLTVEQAREAVAAGAKFLVSPIADRDVIAEAGALDVACIPGAYTPAEMQSAHRFGADFVKVFPAVPGGAEFLRAVLGPLPHLRLFPTAGATPENFTEFLDVGCAGVGLVRSLFQPEDLAKRRFGAITDRARMVFQRLDAWRQTHR